MAVRYAKAVLATVAALAVIGGTAQAQSVAEFRKSKTVELHIG